MILILPRSPSRRQVGRGRGPLLRSTCRQWNAPSAATFLWSFGLRRYSGTVTVELMQQEPASVVHRTRDRLFCYRNLAGARRALLVQFSSQSLCGVVERELWREWPAGHSALAESSVVSP